MKKRKADLIAENLELKEEIETLVNSTKPLDNRISMLEEDRSKLYGEVAFWKESFTDKCVELELYKAKKGEVSF